MNNNVDYTVKIVLIALTLFLFGGCANGLFYFPDGRLYQTPLEFDQKYESVFFDSKDGTRLHGWFLPARRAKGTILHFHGNAQNISTHFKMVKWLPEKGYNVFTFDYRGYGKSEGKPERKGVYEDSIAALEYIAGRQDVNSESLYLIGQSLGGVNCVLTVATIKDIKIRAVVIDSAFSSYKSIAKDKLSMIPVLSLFRTPLSNLIVSGDLSALDYVDKISPVPVLFLHGTKDRVVPLYHGKALYRKAKSPKSIIIVEKGRHIDAFRANKDKIAGKVIAFFNKYSAVQ